ncbi:MAG: AAA family ATPase [Reyranellaceae bacterium]
MILATFRLEREWLEDASENARQTLLRKLDEAREAAQASWGETAWAVLAMLADNGSRRTALLTLDSIVSESRFLSLGVSEGTIRYFDGRVQVVDGWDKKGREIWRDILSPRLNEDEDEAGDDDGYVPRVGVCDRVIDASGLSLVFAAAGGGSRFVHTRSPYYRQRKFGETRTLSMFRVGALSTPIVANSSDGGILAALEEIGEHGRFGLVRLAHLRQIADCDDPEAVVDRITLRTESLLEAARALSLCGNDWSFVLGLPGVAGSEHLSFVVPGFIPAGMPTLFAGAAEAGKSTALHDLALIVATPPNKRDPDRTWLGVPVSEIAHGTAILLSGEDTAPLVAERQRILASGLDPRRILSLPSDGRTLTDIFQTLERVKDLTLLVVDPALKYLIGSGNDDGPVNEFFNELEAFSRGRCAVVVAHHFKKAARAVSLAAAREAIRGSQMWIDRPRAVIALLKGRGAVDAGVIKWNIPPSHPQAKHDRFRYDKSTLRLWPVDEARNPDDEANRRGAAALDDAPVDACPVIDAVRASIEAGTKVTKTGRRGVYEQRLAGDMSRRAAQAAVDAALRSGALILRDDSTLGLPEGGVTTVAKGGNSASGNGNGQREFVAFSIS